jgi:hypothetical protein
VPGPELDRIVALQKAELMAEAKTAICTMMAVTDKIYT